ncbi:hypothetical protein DYB35_000340 [Aphanomyces astaci]|uniref:Importin N-terminal domain-containing protein n=1 Tax=Aphanomyces astaci TaxID=112090 RepID=A0A418DED8_APHAT|nr:hypothetical protein DYB35_000340 [Aphanomyces astaci]
MFSQSDTRAAGEATLQLCMKIPGFALLCLQLLNEAQYQLPAPIRLMVALSLKNAVSTSWVGRGTRQYVISAEEKDNVRRGLLGHMDESSSAVATQLAVTIARIARSDFPKDWPDLFSVLRDNIQQGTLLQKTRALRVLKSVVKELASRRLMSHRAIFNDMSVAVCPFLASVWKSQVAQLSAGNQDVLGNVLSTTKVLHHLVLHGFKVLVPLDVIPFVFSSYFDTFRALTTYISTLPPDTPGVDVLNKIRVSIAGLVVAVQKAHPIEFRAYLGPFLTQFYTTLTDPAPSPDRLVVHLLSYLTNVVGCLLYQQSPSTHATSRTVITAAGDVQLTDHMVDECKAQIGAFGSDVTLLSALLELVVVRYMRLTPDDIAQWTDDPEGYSTLQESLTADGSVRACAEMLYLSLLQTHRDALTPSVLGMMHSTSKWMASPTSAPDDILRADAVLLAAGLSSYDLHESFDFEPWFLRTLVPYLQSPMTVSGVPVLPRRIVWLIGCWLAQLSTQVRIPLYEALLQLLSAAHSDTCVKLAAVQTLESLVNDWGFDHGTFVPFLPSAIGCLYAFFSHPDVVTTDTRLKILGCIEAIVHVCGSAMGPCIVQVVTPLPAIWEAAGSVDANLLRGKILSLLTRIMEIDWHDVSDGELRSMVLSVVSFATNPNQPDSVYLMDQGLALWIRLTEVVDVYTQPLHDVFSNVVLALSRDTEHVQSGLTLLENYAIIGAAAFWSAYAMDVSRLLHSIVGQVKPEISHMVTSVTRVLSALWSVTQEQPRQEKELVVVSFVSTLAAASLRAPSVFLAAVPSAHTPSFLDTMLHLFFSISFSAVGPARRRIWAASLCSFLTVSPAVLDRMGLLLEAIVQVLGDDSNPLDVHDADDADEVSIRRSLLLVRKTKLVPPTLSYIKQYLCAQLNKCSQMYGPEAFNQSMALVEASIVDTIQAL